jgi:hypothetical protein
MDSNPISYYNPIIEDQNPASTPTLMDYQTIMNFESPSICKWIIISIKFLFLFFFYLFNLLSKL